MKNSLKWLVFLVTQISFGFAISHLQEQTDCLFMDPLNCNAYYQCVNNTIVHKFCPNGMQWNSKNNTCDDSELCERDLVSTSLKYEENQNDIHRAAPGKTPAKPIVKPPAKPPIISPIPLYILRPNPTKYICPKQNPSSRFYAHPDCNRFYEEVDGLLIDRACTETRRWVTQQNCCTKTSQCVYNESLYRPNATPESNASALLKLNYGCFMLMFLQVWIVAKLWLA